MYRMQFVKIRIYLQSLENHSMGNISLAEDSSLEFFVLLFDYVESVISRQKDR